MSSITVQVFAILALAFIAGCGSPKGQEGSAPPNPPPPFAAKEVVRGVPEIAQLNAMKMSAGGTGSEVVSQYGVTCGGNQLATDPDGAGLLLTLDGQPLPIARISYWGATAQGWGHPFQGDAPTVGLDSATKTIAVSKKFHAASPNALDGTFTETARLLGDGLVEVNCAYQVPAGAKVTDQALFFTFAPFAVVEGMKLLIDGKPYAFSSAGVPAGKRDVFKGKAQTLVFAPDRPARGFALTFPERTYMELTESREAKDKGNTWKYAASLRVYPKADGAVAFNLDLRDSSAESLKATDSFAGVNFWKDDRLHIPDYAQCRNLAQNPSFEAGLRYYNLYDIWAVWRKRDKPVYAIDETVAKTGNRSLRMNAVKGDKEPGYINTFAIPTIPGKQYTLSFYAKGDHKGELYLQQRCVSGVWMQFPQAPLVAVTETWKRHSYTVTAPNHVLTFLMMPQYYGSDPSGESRVWVDDLQIEEGDKATAFVESPLAAELITSSPDNFLDAKGEKIAAKLRIAADPNIAGSVVCELDDFFYAKPWRFEAAFKTDAKGVAVVDLALDTALGAGVHVLRADFKLDNGFADSDFFRVSRMDFLDNTQKNKNIFASNLGVAQSRGDDLLERCRQVGFGSTNYGPDQPAASAQLLRRLASHGIDFTVDTLASKMKDFGVRENLRELGSVTPDLERRFEEAAFQIARNYPAVGIWCLYSELEGCKLVQSGKFKDFARLQVASFKGVKRSDPNKKYYLGGSCNMQPQAGTRFVDEYIKATEEVDSSVRYDGFTIHPYRTVPENPDLDDDAACFLSVLDKHGYQGAPVLWEEGIYYPYYHIPEWGLDCHRGCSTDHYRAGCPSYHMGWGERVSAAYFARSWLVALKYQDRVKQFNGWCSWMAMDAYLTPFAFMKVPNTLGSLLGDAKFKADVRFAPGMRCYLFEDGQGRPVAALWSHLDQVDRGFAPSPAARFDFKGQHLELFDLMGNPHAVPVGEDGVSELPLTPFPLLVRGEAGTLDALRESLQGARALGSEQPSLQVSAKPLSATELNLVVNNLVTRPFNGVATVGGVARALELGPKASCKLVAPMPMAIPSDRIAAVKLPVSLAEKGFKPLESDLSFDAFAIGRFKGSWAGVPAIPIKNRTVMKSAGGTTSVAINESVGYPGDFEASFQMAWDDAALHLRVEVTDDHFVHDAGKGVSGRWDNDSLQIYLDTLCDARDKATRGFDGNDYNYDFYPNPDGTVTAFRRYAPEQQAAGGLFAPMPNMVEPEIKGAFKRTATGYSYDIAIPKRLVAPFELKAGNSCGLALFLNDKDGEHVKSALTTTPPGTGGYMNPHLYPVMLLTE